MNMETVIAGLAGLVPEENILVNEPMKKHTTFRIGGEAACYVKIQNADQLATVQKFLQQESVPMQVLGNGTLGIILLSVIMILLLSASMSTLEAVVLTSASAVAVDLIPAVRKKPTKPEAQMLLTRLLCLAFVACSFIFATRNIPIIVSLMSFSWGVVSGCFIGPYIWGLFSKKITKIGAYAGVLSGLLTVGGATLVISLQSGFSSAAARSPEMGVAAMAVSLVVVPVVSLLAKNKDSERVEEIFTCYDEK